MDVPGIVDYTFLSIEDYARISMYLWDDQDDNPASDRGNVIIHIMTDAHHEEDLKAVRRVDYVVDGNATV